jgi:indoleamine 2,3-dioxygenase
LAHAYIWCESGHPAGVLPPCLSIPLSTVASDLGIQPGYTYSSSALWNWQRSSPSTNGSLSNGRHKHDSEETVCTFTGTPDESHFDLTSMRVEVAGSAALEHGLRAAHHASSGSWSDTTSSLNKVRDSLVSCRAALLKMRDACDPDTFYYKIRPFLVGPKVRVALFLINCA